nr:uncharacterized protein LOC113460701 [Zonotrichia albicollis]
MAGTSIMYVALNMTSASSFQMLRGSLIIFTGLLSVAFLGRRLEWSHWAGIVLTILGLALVGLADLHGNPGGTGHGLADVITGIPGMPGHCVASWVSQECRGSGTRAGIAAVLGMLGQWDHLGMVGSLYAMVASLLGMMGSFHGMAGKHLGMAGSLLGIGGLLLGMAGSFLGMVGKVLGMAGSLHGMVGSLHGMVGSLHGMVGKLGMVGSLLGMVGKPLGMGESLLGMAGSLLGIGGSHHGIGEVTHWNGGDHSLE